MNNFEHLTRHADLIPFEAYGMGITIVGCGAIGSFVSLQLAKMGFTKQVVYDADVVSVENMSCQFYRHKDIGKNKAMALKELVHDFTNETIFDCQTHWQAGNYLSKDLVIACADDMTVRAALFDAALENGTRFFIDSRMGAESALLYVVDLLKPNLVEQYRKTLYSNEDSVQEKCTAKATIYTANLLSGMVSKAVKNIAAQEPYPRMTLWSIKANDCTQFTESY